MGPQLRRLRDNWLDPSSQVSISVLLQSTNAILNQCAAETNVARVLTKSFHSKPRRVPQEIRKAKSTLKKLHKQMNSEKFSNNYQQLRTDFSEARRIYRKTVRKHRLQDNMKQEEKLMGILSANPSKIFSYIKSCKKTSNHTVDKLVVGEVVYSSQKGPDGFYESMTSLKKCDIDLLQSDEILGPRLSDYDHILKLCQESG